MHLIFATAQTFFSLWMLIDAIRNGRAIRWQLLIMVPFGEVAYFFAVYLPDKGIHPIGDLKKLGRSVVKIPVDVSEAESVAREAPSPENKLKLAEAYLEDGQLENAVRLYEEYVDRYPLELEPRFALATCLIGLRNVRAAVPHLERIVKMDRSWKDFRATFELARALNALDLPLEAEALLSRIANGSQRLAPTIELAQHLSNVGDLTAASMTLRSALQTYDRSPDSIREQDYYQAKRARKLLKSL